MPVLGVIHGDLHDENIIVVDRQLDSCDTFFKNCPIELSGVIDFGDCSESILVEDIVVSIKGFMCSARLKDLCLIDTCGYVLAGYHRQIELNHYEQLSLHLLISGAYCQELILNIKSMENQPDNDYISTIPCSFEDLIKFWNYPRDKLYARWDELAKQYKVV